jgi:hypothetical protein
MRRPFLGRVRFLAGYAFPRWLLFGKICLRYSAEHDSFCCLQKGHAGNHHGDVGFDSRYRKALAFYDAAKARLTR